MSWKSTLASFLLKYVAPTAIDIAKQRFDRNSATEPDYLPAPPAKVRVRRPLIDILEDETSTLDKLLTRDTSSYTEAQLGRFNSQIANVRARIKMYEERLAAEAKEVASPD